MQKFTRAGAGDVERTMADIVVAGMTARDEAAIRHHLDEMKALGVAMPEKFPFFFRLSAGILTQSEHVQVLGTDSSGEVEFVLLFHGNETFVTCGSDHTHRWVERYSMDGSKQMYLFGYRGRDTSGGHAGVMTKQYAFAQMLDPLPNDPKHALIASFPWHSQRNTVDRRVIASPSRSRLPAWCHRPIAREVASAASCHRSISEASRAIPSYSFARVITSAETPVGPAGSSPSPGSSVGASRAIVLDGRVPGCRASAARSARS